MDGMLLMTLVLGEVAIDMVSNTPQTKVRRIN